MTQPSPQLKCQAYSYEKIIDNLKSLWNPEQEVFLKEISGDLDLLKHIIGIIEELGHYHEKMSILEKKFREHEQLDEVDSAAFDEYYNKSVKLQPEFTGRRNTIIQKYPFITNYFFYTT